MMIQPWFHFPNEVLIVGRTAQGAKSPLVLPPLREHEHVVHSSKTRAGMLFSLPADTLQEQREERRITLEDRCEAAVGLVASHPGSSVVWCHLNDEADLLERIIPDCRQVSGSQSEDEKEELLLAFQAGQLKRLVTKPKIGCFGLNWQHCNHVVTFASHSYEQYYQSVRRCWRFGQKRPVEVHVFSSEAEGGVVANLDLVDEGAAGIARDDVLEVHADEPRVERVADRVGGEEDAARGIDRDRVGQKADF